MYTRCPACEAVYELSPAELAEAAGVVRCSNCGKTFNSLAQLFAAQPDSDDLPLRGQGMPPLLSHRILLQPDLPGFDVAPAEPLPLSAPPLSTSADEVPLFQPEPKPLLWPAVTALLALLATAQALWLMELPQRWLDPGGSHLVAGGPDASISLIGRDMHAHPSLDDAMIINALMRNQSARLLEFPLIELRLFDRSNQLLGVRRLAPEDYLPDPARAPSGLAPGASLPLIIEVAVTGSEPTGFEFRFF
ncbi:MAG: DUF3426 domain-containing protein [Wenzhouxiangella sp.]